jgi:hypothetical protein
LFIDKKYESPLKEVVSSTLLGTPGFIGDIKDKYLPRQKEDRYLPALKELKKRIAIEDISKVVDKTIKDDVKLGRTVKIYLSQRYTGDKLADIGKYFGIGGSGVC